MGNEIYKSRVGEKNLNTIESYIITMDTTVQISKELLERLKMMKIHNKESYEDIIWDMIEDRMEFSEETKKNIAQSEKEIKEGKTISLKEVKRELGM
ncbi:hypothetical protein ES703_80117 [subsurface metagenome]